jgi:CheY-like chemotaxis protein
MRRILIVDDDPQTRKVFFDILEHSEWEVEAARSGYRAISMLAERTYDLILLDVMMPGLSGLETIDLLKELQPNVPIVIITARAERDVCQRALNQGALDVVQKPVTATNLLSVVNKSLQPVSL